MNDNSFSEGSGGGRRSRWRREMKFDVVSFVERAYLLGLYLTDGYLDESGRHSAFDFQGNVMSTARWVAELFRRTGLSPTHG